MKKNNIYIFGNADLEMDSIPLRIMPDLQKLFPNITFETLDPNEEWDVTDEMTIIDTAVGIADVTVFDDLEAFDRAPKITMHDFDALTNLRYLQKLGKLRTIRTIGVPPDMDKKKAFESVSKTLRTLGY